MQRAVGCTRPVTLALALALALALMLAWPARLALANGGTIQVSRQPAGPYEITVQTSPSPIRVGEVDVSVLVQRAGADELVQDAQVTVTAEPVTARPGTASRSEATHEQATNKLFYAANVDLPTEGRWRIGVDVRHPTLGAGSVRFEVDASQASLLDGPLLLLGLMLLPLLFVVQWRRRSRSGRRVEPWHPPRRRGAAS